MNFWDQLFVSRRHIPFSFFGRDVEFLLRWGHATYIFLYQCKCIKNVIGSYSLLSLVEKDHRDELQNSLEHEVWSKSALNSALHVASSFGHVASSRLLVDAGANVNAPEETEQHVQRHLSSAAFSREQSVRQVWTRGHTAVGGTPLHRAVENGHAGVVTLLLQYGADVNASDQRGEGDILWCNVLLLSSSLLLIFLFCFVIVVFIIIIIISVIIFTSSSSSSPV